MVIELVSVPWLSGSGVSLDVGSASGDIAGSVPGAEVVKSPPGAWQEAKNQKRRAMNTMGSDLFIYLPAPVMAGHCHFLQAYNDLLLDSAAGDIFRVLDRCHRG